MNFIEPIVLVQENDSILRKKIEQFKFEDAPPNLVLLTEQMFTFMYELDGIGLAAPQIGLDVRLFLMQVDGEPFVCVNPEIVGRGEEQIIHKEGCLSFPKLYLRIKRATDIEVRFWNEHGEEQNRKLNGLASRCFQHELDHLNGITFDQKVSRTVLNIAKRRRLKISKKGEK